MTVQIGEVAMAGTAVVDITKKTFDRTFDATFGEWPDLACVVQSAPMCELGRSADSQQGFWRIAPLAFVPDSCQHLVPAAMPATGPADT